jgi:hypothetical protein
MGLHALAESMGALATNVRGLIRPLAHDELLTWRKGSVKTVA